MSITHEPVPGWTEPGALERKQIMAAATSIAMVGVSANSARPSNFVATYLTGNSTDYDVYFVNPMVDEILGRKCYGSLAELPVAPDIVDVFRKPADLPAVAEEAVAIGAKTFWAQLGLWSIDAATIANQADLSVVMDRCLKIEHARFHGGLHLAGFNTGVISSRRSF